MEMLKKSTHKGQPVKLKIPADTSFIKLVRLLISGQLREKSVDEETIDDLKLVISEVLARAISQDIVEKEIIIKMECSDVMKIVVAGINKSVAIRDLFDSQYLDHEAILGLVDSLKLKESENKGFVLEVTKGLVLDD